MLRVVAFEDCVVGFEQLHYLVHVHDAFAPEDNLIDTSFTDIFRDVF